MKMRPIVYLLMAIIGVSGCASTPVTKKQSQATQTPRIQLKPSPGKEPRAGWASSEVLESDPETGLYFAWIYEMPPTRYFRILGPYDCDEWVRRPYVTLATIRRFPQEYGSGRMAKREAPNNQCVAKLKDKFREDPTMASQAADGAVFDSKSSRITEEGIFDGNAKLKIDGWAIKFAEPTLDEIRERLKPPMEADGRTLNKLDNEMQEQQLRAAAFWIMTNNVSQLAPDLRRLWSQLLYSPSRTRTALLSALASIEPDSADDEFWWRITEKITDDSATQNLIAANVLACRDKPGAASRFEAALKQPVFIRTSAAKALRTMGEQWRILKYEQHGGIASIATDVHMNANNSYTCPYRGGKSVDWWQ